MMDMSDMMQRCMDMMNGSGSSMMGGGMMGSSLLFLILAAMLLIWLIGLAALGGLGFWAYRRYRSH